MDDNLFWNSGHCGLGNGKKEKGRRRLFGGRGDFSGLFKVVDVKVITSSKGCLQLCTLTLLNRPVMWLLSSEKLGTEQGARAASSHTYLIFIQSGRVLLSVLDMGDHGKIFQNSRNQEKKKRHILGFEKFLAFIWLCASIILNSNQIKYFWINYFKVTQYHYIDNLRCEP